MDYGYRGRGYGYQNSFRYGAFSPFPYKETTRYAFKGAQNLIKFLGALAYGLIDVLQVKNYAIAFKVNN